MLNFDDAMADLARRLGALGEMLACLPLALWLGAGRRGARNADDPVFIHIDEWGRITRVPGRRQRLALTKRGVSIIM